MVEKPKNINQEWRHTFERLNRARTQKDNKVSYEALASVFWNSLLSTSIKFDEKIPQAVRDSIVTSALFSPTSDGKINSQKFWEAVETKEREYLKKQKEEFYLLTNILISGTLPFKKIKIRDSFIYLGINNKKYCRRSLATRIKSMFPKHKDGGVYFLIKTAARSPLEAGDIALYDLDILRGIFNLLLGYAKMTIIESHPSSKPINCVNLGDIHTLHYKDGKLAFEDFWYELNDFPNREVYNISPKSEKVRKQTFKMIKRILLSVDLKEDVYEAIVRYTQALDHRNYDSVYIDLWSLLEFLTVTEQNSYDVTIRRISALYSNSSEATEILTRLRDFRNNLIHRNYKNQISIIILQTLKKFVEDALLFYINNPLHLKNRAEIAEFLDLSKAKDHLQKRKSLINKALSYHANPVT